MLKPTQSKFSVLKVSLQELSFRRSQAEKGSFWLGFRTFLKSHTSPPSAPLQLSLSSVLNPKTTYCKLSEPCIDMICQTKALREPPPR